MEFSEPCFHEDLESTRVEGDPHSGFMLSHTIEVCITFFQRIPNTHSGNWNRERSK